MRPSSAGKSSSSEHACITSVALSVVCGREHILVEDEEALEYLEVLFIEYRAPDTIVQLLVRKRSFGVKALIGKRGPYVNKCQ
jgi:hypothetical protein